MKQIAKAIVLLLAGAAIIACGSSTDTSSTSSGSSMGQITVPCAGNPCMPGQVCCHHAGQPMQDTCGAAGSCAGGTAELSCHGPADCPGATCCGEWDPQTMDYTQVRCEPTCVDGGGKIRILQCEGDPSVCPMGQMCYMSPLLGKGYSFCQ